MKLTILARATGAALMGAVVLALPGCLTRTFSYKDPRPGAPICETASFVASQSFAPGSCARLGWDIDPEFARTPDEAFRFLCEVEADDAALAAGVCDRAAKISVTDKRQELAQLLACGRGDRVMVEDLWRFGDEGYEGVEVLRLPGGDVRARWRGGVPFVGWTFQEILLESPATPAGEGCTFLSYDLPGERVRRRVAH